MAVNGLISDPELLPWISEQMTAHASDCARMRALPGPHDEEEAGEARRTYRVKPRAGIAFGARYSHASVPLTATATTDAGGLHVTVGLRVRF